MKKLLLFCFLTTISSLAWADTVTLLSGDTIEGTILEKTNDYIKIEIDQDLSVTYYLDEVQEINSVSVHEETTASSPSPAPEIRNEKSDLENLFTQFNITPATPPIEITKVAIKEFNDNPQNSISLALLAHLYGAYDVTRIKDKTAHQAFYVLRLSMGPIWTWAASRPQAYRKAIEDVLNWAKQSSAPSYYPEWMINHGMGSMRAALEQKQADYPFYEDHDPQADWQETVNVFGEVLDNPEFWEELKNQVESINSYENANARDDKALDTLNNNVAEVVKEIKSSTETQYTDVPLEVRKRIAEEFGRRTEKIIDEAEKENQWELIKIFAYLGFCLLLLIVIVVKIIFPMANKSTSQSYLKLIERESLRNMSQEELMVWRKKFAMNIALKNFIIFVLPAPFLMFEEVKKNPALILGLFVLIASGIFTFLYILSYFGIGGEVIKTLNQEKDRERL